MGGPSGILIVDKPSGMTSHDVVSRIRRLMGTRRVGHAGTLDPMATGVLVVGVERATRLLGQLALTDKAYSATVRLGSSTITDDREGEVVAAADPSVVDATTEEQVRSAFAALVGEVDQVPSSVSAIKVDGRKSYDRVRAGEDVVLAARRVTIASIDIIDLRCVRESAPDSTFIDVDIDVECSTGTYIRAIARDVGAALGIGGHLTALRRTRVGPFSGAAAVPPDIARVEDLLGLGHAAAMCLPSRRVDRAAATEVSHGRRIPWEGPAELTAILDEDGELLALATERDGMAAYQAVFVGA